MRNDFDKAMHFRHACKLFNEQKEISQEDFEFILEAGRRSPSSFGMEQWQFFVIQDEKMREEIRTVAWDQPQITTASKLVVVTYKKQVRSSDEYIQNEFDKFQYPDYVRDAYKQFIDPRDDETLESWSAKQVYIAAGNMMTAAASIGIDSCPIEGFDKESVEKIMGLDTTKYGVAILLPFGYRVNEQPPLHRSNLEEIVSYI